MKHQQGEQEALAHELFTAAQLAPGEGIEDAVGRLAALVEAQQSEVASSSIFDGVIPAAIRRYLRKCSSGGMSKKHIDIVQINVDEAERLDYFKLAIAEAVIASRVATPQPAPVAPAVQQTVSQPAKVWDYPPMPDFDTVEQHIYGACRRYITQDMLEPIHNLIRDAIDADRAARAPADSTPAWASQAVIEYRYTGGTHWCQLGPAERMKPNFDGVYRLQGGVFPVDAAIDASRKQGGA